MLPQVTEWKKKDEGYTYASVYQTWFGNKAFGIQNKAK